MAVLTKNLKKSSWKYRSALVYTMKGDRSTSVHDDNKKLLPNFIFVSKSNQKTSLRYRRQRKRSVLVWRMVNFYIDRKRPLIDRLPELVKPSSKNSWERLKTKLTVSPNLLATFPSKSVPTSKNQNVRVCWLNVTSISMVRSSFGYPRRDGHALRTPAMVKMSKSHPH